MSTPSPGPGPGPVVPPPPPYTPPPVYAQPPPPPPAKRRRVHPLLIVGGGFLLLLCMCSVVSQIGTRGGPAIVATQTAQAIARGNTGAAPANTAVPAVPPTPAPPTATPIPVLGFADTATFPDWVMSLGKLETHAQMVGGSATGRYWVVALDARNTGEAAHPLTDSFQFTLRDSKGYNTPVLTTAVVDYAIKAAGREALNTIAQPQGLVHPLLVFDVPAAALPQQLVIHRLDPVGDVVYDLVATAQAAATAEAQVQATQAAVAQAQATTAAATAEVARAKAVQATTTAAATAEVARAKAAQATTTAEAKRVAGLVNTPAKGIFRGSNSDFQVVLRVESYEKSLGYYTASRTSRYVVLGVTVWNEASDSQYVNPNDFTLTMTDGDTYAYDTATYVYERPFPGVSVPAGANANGALVFLASNQAAPHFLIFKPTFGREIRIDLTVPGEPEK